MFLSGFGARGSATHFDIGLVPRLGEVRPLTFRDANFGRRVHGSDYAGVSTFRMIGFRPYNNSSSAILNLDRL